MKYIKFSRQNEFITYNSCCSRSAMKQLTRMMDIQKVKKRKNCFDTPKLRQFLGSQVFLIRSTNEIIIVIIFLENFHTRKQVSAPKLS